MFIYRDYKWRELPLLVARVVRTVGIVMILIGFSVAFGYMMALMQVPAKAAQFFLAVADNKYILLLLINVLLLVLGTFMDLAPMLLICTPIFLPIVIQFGIDPVHFGIIMILNLGIGLLTPPVGPTLVVGCAIGKVSMETLSREHPALLHPDAVRADPGDLRSRALALAAEPVQVLTHPDLPADQAASALELRARSGRPRRAPSDVAVTASPAPAAPRSRRRAGRPGSQAAGRR